MDFALSEEQEAIREGVRDVVAKYDLEYWRERDKLHEFASDFWEALGKSGYLGVAIPEEYGGAGLGMLEMAIVCEEACAAGGGSTASQLFMLTPVFGGMSIVRHGSEEQKQRYLPALATGRLDFCMALTEPDAGTDTLAIQTFARKDGDGYVISGQKVWITGVEQADCMLLVARTTPLSQAPSRSFGLSLFLVDPKDPAIEFHPLEKLGTNTVSSSIVYIDNLRVGSDALLGQEGKGWSQIVDTLNCERIVTTAGCTATADLALRLASQYARDRAVFGRPIGVNQGIQFPLASLKIQTELARLMNYKAAWLFDSGQQAATATNIAKFSAAEAAFSACDQAIQTHGGFGYSVEYNLERLWRDVRLFRLAPVAQEMILAYIAQHVLGLPRSY